MVAARKIAPTRRGRYAAWVCFAGLLALAASAQGGEDVTQPASRVCTDARIANAWRVLRVVDCARCHGKDYAGFAAPSIVAYAATQSREIFVRTIIDGDPIRGMPGYRDNAYVAENVEDIYCYFLARANGQIGPDYRPPMSSVVPNSQ
jgi:hypothetical protein